MVVVDTIFIYRVLWIGISHGLCLISVTIDIANLMSLSFSCVVKLCGSTYAVVVFACQVLVSKLRYAIVIEAGAYTLFVVVFC
ncbi:membrane protein [gut metagenome]|uniref:Membrane protein n=1 Tax=gut metagenome TaxID=749906 RepID=J9F775_9ZZZZ